MAGEFPGDFAFTISGKAGGGGDFFLATTLTVFEVLAASFEEAFAFLAGLAEPILSARSSTAFASVIASGAVPSGKDTFVFPHLM